MTNLNNILKSRDITLLTKLRIVQAMVFPVVIYGYESWTIKKSECQRIGVFKLLCWRRLFENPLDCKKVKPVHPKENQPWIFTGRTDAKAEAPILWPSDGKSRFIGKDPDAGEDWRQKEKGAAKDEWLNNTTNSVDLNLSKLREIVKDKGVWHAAVHGVTKSWTWLSNWTELNWCSSTSLYWEFLS